MPVQYRNLENCLQNLVLAIRNAARAIRFHGEYGPYEEQCTEQWLRILEEFADTIEGYLVEPVECIVAPDAIEQINNLGDEAKLMLAALITEGN